MRYLIFISLFTICFSCSTVSLGQNIDSKSSTTGFYEKVDSIVINKMNQYDIPGLAVGVVRNDSIIYTKGYGVKKVGSDNPVNDNSIFHTASISKLFTASAVMQLIDKKLISIDSKVVDVLPELNYSDERIKEITIKHLLNHTLGLPDIDNYHWKSNHQHKNSLQDYILGLNLNVTSEPTDEYRYSNLGYDILGYVIEKVSGVTFEKYVKDHILNPSGMDDSDFRYFKIPDSLKVSPHSKRWISQKIYSRKIYPYTREHAPSSTLNASAKDLSKWMVFFLEKLNDEGPANIYSIMLEPSFGARRNIGLGFQLYDFEEKKAVGHFGGDKGFRSFLMMIPDENIGLVVLGNCDYEEDYRQEIIMPIAKIMLTKK